MSERPDLPDALRRPHPSRIDPGHPDYPEILRRHDAAIARGDAFYVDPSSGLWVMTAAALYARPCCEHGCRHCPWIAIDERLA